MAPLQHSPRCILVHEESGIRSLDELRDLTLAMSPSSTFSLYLQKKVPLEGVRIVPYSVTSHLF
jgi:NitT/TauT family transport system substrate-binding protein